MNLIKSKIKLINYSKKKNLKAKSHFKNKILVDLFLKKYLGMFGMPNQNIVIGIDISENKDISTKLSQINLISYKIQATFKEKILSDFRKSTSSTTLDYAIMLRKHAF